MNDYPAFMDPSIDVGARGRAVRRGSLGTRLLAQLLANRLDRQLAVGIVGPPGSAIDLRAAHLESDDQRQRIARALRRAVVEAREGRPPAAVTVPIHRRNVVEAEDTIDAITLRLHSPRRVNACGMALLQRTLSDGCGPLYACRSGDLNDCLRVALAAL